MSLVLARRRDTPKASVRVGVYLIVTPGQQAGPFPQYVSFRIVNEGDRMIRVTQIGWRVGLLRKRHCIQTFEESLSSKLPVELQHGQEAQWLVPMKMPDRAWADNFVNAFLARTPWPIWRWTLRARVFSSVGATFEVRPGADLLTELRQAQKTKQLD